MYRYSRNSKAQNTMPMGGIGSLNIGEQERRMLMNSLDIIDRSPSEKDPFVARHGSMPIPVQGGNQ